MYRDLSAFFYNASYGRTVATGILARQRAALAMTSVLRTTSAWSECCTNGRCNNCK